MASILQTNQLTKQYGTFKALDGCDLRVEEHSIFGLLGPNGSGKTTLIRCLLGYLSPTSGQATIGGLDCRTETLAVRRMVGYLPAEPKLFRLMRGRDCVEFFTSIHPRGNRSLALKCAERLSLDLSRRVAFMSTGMRRKLSICCVLGCPSPLMILDEPTENLDPTVRNGVIEMVQEIHGQGSTIIFCSHILSEIESLCDTVGVLRQGKIVCSARVDEVRTTHVLRGELDRARTLDQLPPGVTLQKRDGDAIVLELAGGLDQYIDWLAALRLRNVRMELVGLRGLYEEYHQPKSVSDSEVFAEAK